ncbi:MAG: hypothetical protein H4O13_02400 [Xanthomonadales bacterium]|nr:hypothetical protein [Xanthomonadales bacterium]
MSDLLTLLETLGRSPTLRLEDLADQLDAATRRQVAALAADASTLSCLVFTPEEAANEANTYFCWVATPEEEIATDAASIEAKTYFCAVNTPELEVRTAEPYFCGVLTPEELA